MTEKNIDKQSRKWQLTINNPVKWGLDHIRLKEILATIKPIQYWCISDEMGRAHHTHVYIACSSPIRFSTLKNKFPQAHLEIARGTSEQNRDYVFKQGKWEKDRKKETNLSDTHEEFGELPIERRGARNDLIDLYDMIKEGASDAEILENNPEYLNQIERMDKVRQTIVQDRFKNTFRKLKVLYIFGTTGAGKTRNIMEMYGYENVYRITNYLHPFDLYKNQDVVIFEEYRSSLPLSDMLNYLDGYPVILPCRYNDKMACYTKVYIISNIDLLNQYEDVQRLEPETWKALLRRISNVIKYNADGSTNEYTVKEYLDAFYPVTDADQIPFKEDTEESC